MIHKNWHELIKPSGLNLVNNDQNPNFATIVVEPLERGFGLTLGNALRRTLLSSLQGASITSVKINSVLHEFSSIPGVREDVTDMVLNLKDIAVDMEVEGPKKLSLRFNTYIAFLLIFNDTLQKSINSFAKACLIIM